MRHACPQCGKKFDYEKEGWICPFCGSVVLASTEKKMYQAEQLKKEQKQQPQSFPNQTYHIPQRTTMQKNRAGRGGFAPVPHLKGKNIWQTTEYLRR